MDIDESFEGEPILSMIDQLLYRRALKIRKLGTWICKQSCEEPFNLDEGAHDSDH